MSKGKEKIIEIIDDDELSFLSDMLKRFGFNPKTPLKNIGDPNVKDNTKRTSSKVSFLFEENVWDNENISKDLISDRTLGVNLGESSSEENNDKEIGLNKTRPAKRRKVVEDLWPNLVLLTRWSVVLKKVT